MYVGLIQLNWSLLHRTRSRNKWKHIFEILELESKSSEKLSWYLEDIIYKPESILTKQLLQKPTEILLIFVKILFAIEEYVSKPTIAKD